MGKGVMLHNFTSMGSAPIEKLIKRRPPKERIQKSAGADIKTEEELKRTFLK